MKIRTEKRRIGIVVLCLCVGVVSTCAGKVIYVDDDASGANDGTSWGDAYFYLQDALMFAVAGDEIRVAQGVYRPDDFVLSDRPSRGREETFQLINGVTLKGGYAGLGAPDTNARDVRLYETILSGDLNEDDVEVGDACDLGNEPSRAENSYNVVRASITHGADVLDGFTITGGNANSLGYEDANSSGGGVYGAAPILLNCTLTHNYASQGGGVFGWGVFVDCTFVANSAGTGGAVCGHGNFSNCTFIGNRARGEGGAISGEGDFTGCTFRRNSAGYDGGVMYVCDNDVTFIDCSLEENSASNSGGGIFVYQGDVELTNCILRGNSANQGGAVANDCSYFTLTDCTLTGNSASQSGGGVWNWGSMIVTGCSITNNRAEQGGGLCNSFSELILANCRLTGNRALQSGGGLWNICSDLYLPNCTFAGNSAGLGYALAFNPWEQRRRNIHLVNCILWDGGDEIWNNDYPAEIAIAHSNVQGGPAAVYDPCNIVVWGEGIIDVEPCFADPGYWDPNGTPEDANDDFWVDGDYHLKSQGARWDANEGRWMTDDVTSTCIDAGDPMSPIGLEVFPNGGVINMGVYGGTAQGSKSYFGKAPCETIVAGDINGDCAIDFRDFMMMAGNWLVDCYTTPEDLGCVPK